MRLNKTVFGTHEGQDIYRYDLENDNRMHVRLMNYGATITAIEFPGPRGLPQSLACGFDRFEDYLSEEYRSNAPYFGATVGRYCGQIKDARFCLNGKEYKLADNCGANNLHGGVRGFDKRIWDAEPFENATEVGVIFTLSSSDMEEGFPGNVKAEVIISLNQQNEIHIQYKAVPDKDTPLSMTNHTYFNLGAFGGNVLDHMVKVHSSQRLELDDTGAASGKVLDLEGKPDDLRPGKKVGEVQELQGGGFEHFFVFDSDPGKLKPVAEITDPVSRRTLIVESSEPCMLFYSGIYTSDAFQRNENEHYGQFRAFCCETHRYPNGPNIAGSPGSITKAGEEFSSRTVFRFS